MPGRRVGWPLVAAAATAVALLASATDLGQRIESGLADSGARLLLHEIDSDVVIVGIDAKSLAELNEWPWPRRHHAAVIDNLAPAAPKQVFLDIDFSSSSNPVDDRRLEEALGAWRGSPIILPAFLQHASNAGDDVVLTEPLARFRPHVTLGSVNLQPGDDGLVRDVQVDQTGAAPAIPPVASLLAAHGAANERILLDFTIDPNSFDYVSYSDVLAHDVAAEAFAGKTVLVGATAIELGDIVPVPVYQSLPGVVVLALAYESARGERIAEVPPVVYWSLVIAWTLLVSFCYCRQSWRRNALVVCASLLVLAGLALALYAVFRTVLPVVPFGIASLVSYVMATLRSLESETLRALAYAVGLRRRDALLKSIVLSSTDSIVCVDGSGAIKTANPAAATLFRRESEQLIGTSIFDLVPSLASDSDGVPEDTLPGLVDSIIECSGRTSSGDEFPVELSFSRVRLKDEELYTAIIRDISERKAQQRQLQFQATHDPLTTLPNRAALAAYLDSMLAGTNGKSLALLMIDLDRFKEVNDTLGHNVGDYVLYEVARRLGDVTRERGFIARIGGDEFALVVEACDRENLSGLSQQLVDCLKKPIETCGVAIDVGLSIGISIYPQDAGDAETLFKNSDVAMYVAKRSASGFEYYDSANDRHSIRKLTIVTRLRQAIAGRGLELHYQPQVNLATGRVDGCEALIRWRDEKLGLVNPDEFIALAESTDLIQPLSHWTMTEALRQSASWRREGIDLRIAINLSARMLQDAGFPARFSGMLRAADVPPAQVELEITESAMMIDPNRALRIVDELEKLGIFISIDDYGTGYSSLSYLRDLPAHALKLDRSFVSRMHERSDDRVIVASTVQMAHGMNRKVVAEGVETAEDAALLRELGYDYAQGYWYSKALPAEAFVSWLREFHSASLHEIRPDRAQAS